MDENSNLVDERFAAELKRSVEEYYARILQTPSLKASCLNLDMLHLPSSQTNIAITLREMWRTECSPFHRFSFAKHALELCAQIECFADVGDLLEAWLHACVEVGAYDDCIRFADVCLGSKGNIEASSEDKLSILMSRAKSLRNIGRFEDAKQCYRDFLNLAEDVGDPVRISLGLILIGKLYGNYLGQRSLFCSFIEEAQYRLERDFVKDFTWPEVEQVKSIRSLAICYDALGQAYRPDEWSDDDQYLKEQVKVEEYFVTAIELNEQIGRWNGVSRSKCHLNYFKFFQPSSVYNEMYLKSFWEGVNILLTAAPDPKGLGIRSIQYARMLWKIGRTKEAREYLKVGRNLADQYSDYKTLARAAIIESEFIGISDPEGAIRALKEGRDIARRYKLHLQEGEINRRLAEICGVHSICDVEVHLPELFNRNREIYVRLINEVKGTLAQIDSNSKAGTEFHRLSLERKQEFRSRLLLDFDHTVNQLDLNVKALTTALQLNERQRQELVVYDVVHSVARLLLHEYKAIILEDKAFTPLRGIASTLENLAHQVKNKEQSVLQPSSAEKSCVNEDVNSVAHSLYETAQLARKLSKELEELKDTLTRRLRRPKHLEDIVSLNEACKIAIRELVERNSNLKDKVILTAFCDIRFPFNNDILVTTIHNLIRNAIEGSGKSEPLQDTITIVIGSELISDELADSSSKTGYLVVLREVENHSKARGIAIEIQKGLDQKSSSKESGTGVGIDLVRLVFQELMKAHTSVFLEECRVGIKICLKDSLKRIEIVTEERDA